MKKIIPLLLIIYTIIFSLSMHNNKASTVDEYKYKIKENYSLGYSDIPSDNGL